MLIRRKIARSVVRRVKRSESKKPKRKLRQLRSRKNAARKYSSKSGLNFREMMGGMKGNVTYLVYYGSPKIRNPSVRLLHTFVGILFCDGNNWILCVSSELADKYSHFRYARMEKNLQPDVQKSIDAQSDRLKEQYAAIDKIIDDLLDDGIRVPISKTHLIDPDIITERKYATAHNIVCQFIKHLCNLNEAQEEKLKAYLESNHYTITNRRLYHGITFKCDFNWVFTFNKNLFSSGGDLSEYLDGKQVKVLEKVMPIDNPQLEGLISELSPTPASASASASASTTSSTSSPEVVNQNFLMVVPKSEPKYPGTKIGTIIHEASTLLVSELANETGTYWNQQKFDKIIGRIPPFRSEDDVSLYYPKDNEIVNYLKEISA
jgi:hypothetical protein